MVPNFPQRKPVLSMTSILFTTITSLTSSPTTLPSLHLSPSHSDLFAIPQICFGACAHQSLTLPPPHSCLYSNVSLWVRPFLTTLLKMQLPYTHPHPHPHTFWISFLLSFSFFPFHILLFNILHISLIIWLSLLRWKLTWCRDFCLLPISRAVPDLL